MITQEEHFAELTKNWPLPKKKAARRLLTVVDVDVRDGGQGEPFKTTDADIDAILVIVDRLANEQVYHIVDWLIEARGLGFRIGYGEMANRA